MIAAILLLLAGGIGLALAVSDPSQVTLRWLRLGGIIALTLTAVAAVIHLMARGSQAYAPLLLGLFTLAALPFAAQVIAVQQARRRTQRILAWAGFLTATILAWGIVVHPLAPRAHETDGPAATQTAEPHSDTRPSPYLATADLAGLSTYAASAALLGGSLMTMLLGHAYLTAGDEMTQKPFARLVLFLAGALLARALLSVSLGLMPWLQMEHTGGGIERVWTQVMLAARYAVGIVVPGVFVYMTYDCVKRRSNQSATGILYVAGLLLILGEGIAMALGEATGAWF